MMADTFYYLDSGLDPVTGFALVVGPFAVLGLIYLQVRMLGRMRDQS